MRMDFAICDVCLRLPRGPGSVSPSTTRRNAFLRRFLTRFRVRCGSAKLAFFADPYDQQVAFLQNRQAAFKQAALDAKRRGDKAAALDYLRKMKGFDDMIEAAKNGLKVCLLREPTSLSVVTIPLWGAIKILHVDVLLVCFFYFFYLFFLLCAVVSSRVTDRLFEHNRSIVYFAAFATTFCYEGIMTSSHRRTEIARKIVFLREKNVRLFLDEGATILFRSNVIKSTPVLDFPNNYQQKKILRFFNVARHAHLAADCSISSTVSTVYLSRST